MTANITPVAQFPPPLAEDAATASTTVGACHLCQRGILRGQRYGRLVPSGRIAHVVCISAQALAPARRAA